MIPIQVSLLTREREGEEKNVFLGLSPKLLTSADDQ